MTSRAAIRRHVLAVSSCSSRRWVVVGALVAIELWAGTQIALMATDWVLVLQTTLGAAVVALILYRVEAGIYITLMLAVLFADSIPTEVGLHVTEWIDLHPFDILVFSTLFSWFVRIRTKQPAIPSSLNKPIIGFLAVVGVAAFLGLVYGNSPREILVDLRSEVYYLFYFPVAACIRERRQVRCLLAGMLGLNLLTAVFGYYLSVVGKTVWGVQGIIDARTAHTFGLMSRSYNTLQPLFWVFCILLALGVVSYSTSSKIRRGLWAIILILGGATVLTLARNVWMGLVGGFGFMVITGRRRRLSLVGWAAIVLVPALAIAQLAGILWGGTDAIPSVVNRFATIFAPETYAEGNLGYNTGYGRLLEWRAVVPFIRERPLFGSGLGAVTVAVTTEPVLQIHSGYGYWLWKTGVVGLLAFSWLSAAFVASGLRLARAVPAGTYRGLLLGMVACYIVLLVMGVAGSHMFTSFSSILLIASGMGLVTALTRLNNQGSLDRWDEQA